MTLLHKDEPILRKEMPFFDFDNPPTDPIKLKNEMVDRMFEEGGIGLSANQIGYEYRVFVMKGQNKEQSMFFCKSRNHGVIRRNRTYGRRMSFWWM